MRGDTSGDSCGDAEVRWQVSFAADLATRMLTFYDGELLLRRDALRLVLKDSRGVTVDARYLRAAEEINIGGVIAFPCHFARVRDRLPAASRPVRFTAAPEAVQTEKTQAERAVRSETGPRFPNRPPMADARHVGSHPGVHPRPGACDAGIKSPLTRCLT